jgi:hypothetical protein
MCNTMGRMQIRISDAAKAFYLRWEFEELPGNPWRLFLSADQLADLMEPL